MIYSHYGVLLSNKYPLAVLFISLFFFCVLGIAFWVALSVVWESTTEWTRVLRQAGSHSHDESWLVSAAATSSSPLDGWAAKKKKQNERGEGVGSGSVRLKKLLLKAYLVFPHSLYHPAACFLAHYARALLQPAAPAQGLVFPSTS
jgi:predicted PurR-regulated permease PerM